MHSLLDLQDPWNRKRRKSMLGQNQGHSAAHMERICQDCFSFLAFRTPNIDVIVGGDFNDRMDDAGKQLDCTLTPVVPCISSTSLMHG